MAGQLLGTPAYMAPEQAEGRQHDTDWRTDVYGLGAILYEILTGQPPFHAKTTKELLRKVRKETPLPPRHVNPQVAPALQAVCLKALSKVPGDRYASAAELAQEVQRYLADEPVLAYPEPWTRRTARWARKHRTAVAAAAGLLVAATVALSVSTVLIARERNEAQDPGRAGPPGRRRHVHQGRRELAGRPARPAPERIPREGPDLLRELHRLRGGRPGGAARARPGLPADGRDPPQARPVRRRGAGLPQGPRAARAPRRRGGLRRRGPPRPGRDPDPAGRPPVPSATDSTRRRASSTRRPRLLEPMAAEAAATGEDRWLLARALRSKAELLRRKGDLARPPGPSPCVPPTSWSRSSRPIPSPPRSATTSPRRTTSWAGSRATWARRTPTSAPSAGPMSCSTPWSPASPPCPATARPWRSVCNGLGRPGARDRPAGRVRGPLAARCSPRPSGWPRTSPIAPSTGGSWPAGYSNVGGILAEQDRFAEAEPILRRGIELNTELLAKSPDDRGGPLRPGHVHL